MLYLTVSLSRVTRRPCWTSTCTTHWNSWSGNPVLWNTCVELVTSTGKQWIHTHTRLYTYVYASVLLHTVCLLKSVLRHMIS